MDRSFLWHALSPVRLRSGGVLAAGVAVAVLATGGVAVASDGNLICTLYGDAVNANYLLSSVHDFTSNLGGGLLRAVIASQTYPRMAVVSTAPGTFDMRRCMSCASCGCGSGTRSWCGPQSLRQLRRCLSEAALRRVPVNARVRDRDAVGQPLAGRRQDTRDIVGRVVGLATRR